MRTFQITIPFAWLQVALFLVIISAPLLTMLTGNTAVISNYEQRYLAAKPALSWQTSSFKEFPQKYTDYFKDHFGLRSQILTQATYFNEAVFNRSVTNKVVIGHEDWRFYDIDGSVRNYVGDYTPSIQTLENWSLALSTKQKWLERQGVRYLLVPIPGKMSVYPEFLPHRIRTVAKDTRLQSFIRYLSDPVIPESILDTEQILLDAKLQRQLYFKTDTHWTDDGAYVVYAAAIERLSRWFPQLMPLKLAQFDRRDSEKIGDISRAAHRPITKGEPWKSLHLRNPCAGDNYREIAEFAQTAAYQAYPKALPDSNGCKSKSLRAIVVHDSFGVYLKKFLNENFEEVIYMRHYDVFGMKSFIQTFKPDVFIDFRAGRRFHYLLGPDSRIIEEVNSLN